MDLVRYVAVDDVGRKINPMIVDGQLHGGIAQGIGQALWEGAVYSDDGQLLSRLDAGLRAAPRLVAAQPSSSTRRSRRHRSTRSASRASVRRAASPAPPPSRTRSSTRSARWASGTSTCRTRHRRCGARSRRRPMQRRREGRPGMIPAAFGYTRAGSVDEALAALAVGGRNQGHRRWPEPAAADEAAPRVGRRRWSTSGGWASCAGSGSSTTAGSSVGALTTYAELADSPAIHYGVLQDALPEHRRRPGPQPRHRGRRDRARGPGLGLRGRRARARCGSGAPVGVGQPRRSRPTASSGPFTTAMRPDELLTRIVLPAPLDNAGSAYASLEQPASGYPMVGRRRRDHRRRRRA